MRTAASILVVLLSAAPLAAAPDDFVGPLRIRDMSPLSILRLDMPPAHAASQFGRGWGFEVHLSHANIYNASDSVVEYLRARDSRDPISAAEAEEILTLEGDVFYFDFEAAILNLSTTWAPTERLQFTTSVPVHYYGGGVMDATIEGFHRAFGLGNGNRDAVGRGHAQIIESIGEDRFVVLGINNNSGVADPTFSVRFAEDVGSWNLVGEAAAKMPIGNEEAYFSSGSWDYGVQLSAQRKFDRRAVYVSLSNIWVGSTGVLPSFRVNDTPSVAVSFERLLSAKSSVIMQASWSRSNFERAVVSEAADDRTQITLGGRRRYGNSYYSFAVTENVANFNNTPDLALHFGFCYMVPSR